MKKLLKDKKPEILISLSGLLLGFTVIFAKLGVLAYFALIPMALVFLKRVGSGAYGIKRSYIDGFIFYLSFDLVVFHWFTYFYPLDFAGIDNFSAIFIIFIAWFGISAFQSLFSALVFVLAAKLANTSICRKHPVFIIPFVAALFAVNEWSQTFTWAGIPWGRIAVSQTEIPIFIQSASLFGSYFLTFLIVFVNFMIAYAIMFADKRKLIALCALCVLAFNALLGTVLYFLPSVNESRSIKVASVQGNIETQTSYDALDEIYEAYDGLIRSAAAEGAELIVLPEGAFPIDIHDKLFSKDYGIIDLSVAVSNLAKELDVTIVIGTYIDMPEKSNTSMSVFYSDGTSNVNAYAKRRLVPFGEFLPMMELVNAIAPVLAEINIFSEITPGKESTVFDASLDENPIKVGTLMCFDSVYEKLGIDSARAGAELFIVPSNDTWFYDSRALDMHHSQNILRAVEQGKYTVSCANTGITSVVSDKGEIISKMPICKEGYIIETVYASSGKTLYSCIGNLFVYICVLFIIAPIAIEIYKKKSFKF